jgi:hypothetical protein
MPLQVSWGLIWDRLSIADQILFAFSVEGFVHKFNAQSIWSETVVPSLYFLAL